MFSQGMCALEWGEIAPARPDLSAHTRLPALAAAHAVALGALLTPLPVHQAITPPNSSWQTNLEAAIANGALEAIVELLDIHGDDENIAAACAACLKAISQKPELAELLIANGVLAKLLERVLANPDSEVARVVMSLLEYISRHNPALLLQHGYADVASQVLQRGLEADNDEIVALATSVLERLNLCAEGPAALHSAGAFSLLLDVVERPVDHISMLDIMARAREGGAEDEADLMPAKLRALTTAFRVLDRVSRNPEYIKPLLDAGAAERCSEALDLHAQNEDVMKMAARLLTRLARGNLPLFLERARAAQGGDLAKLLRLIGNLALEQQTAAELTEAGAVGLLLSIVDAFLSGNATEEVCAAASRALARLMRGDPAAIQGVLSEGGLDKLMAALRQAADGKTVSAIVEALAALARDPDAARALAAAGVAREMLRLLLADECGADTAGEVLGFFEAWGTEDPDGLRELGPEGLYLGVAKAMTKFPAHADVNLNGSRVGIYLADTEYAAGALLEQNILPPVTALLRGGKTQPMDTLTAALFLTASLALIDSAAESLKGTGLVRCMGGILARSDITKFARECIADLLTCIMSVEEAIELLRELERAGAKAMSSRSAEDLANLANVLIQMSAVVASPVLATAVLGAGLSAVLAKVASGLGGLRDTKLAGDAALSTQETLAALLRTVTQDSVSDLSTAFTAELIKGGNAALKTHASNREVCMTGVPDFLAPYAAASSSCAANCLANGAVDAVTAAMRAHPEHVAVNVASLDLLYQLAADQAGAVAVAQSGATRPVVTLLNVAVNKSSFAPVLDAALLLLDRVSQVSEGLETLRRQKAVEPIVGALAVVLTYSTSEKVCDAALSLLSRLLTPEIVRAANEKLLDLVNSPSLKRSLGDAEGHRNVISIVVPLGIMAASAGQYLDLANTTVPALQKLIDTILAHGDDAAKKTLLPPCMAALERVLSNNADALPADVTSLLETVKRCLQAGLAVREAVGVLAAVARKDPDAAAAVLGDPDCMAALLKLLDPASSDVAAAIALLSSLASLSRSAAARALLEQHNIAAAALAWLDAHMMELSNAQLAAGMLSLARMAESSLELANQITRAGLRDFVAAAVDTRLACSKPSTEVADAICQMLGALCGAADECTRACMDQDCLRRVLAAMASAKPLTDSAGVCSALLNMMADAGDWGIEDVRERLKAAGAVPLVLSAMSAHATSESVMAAGSRALRALGLGAEIVEQAAARVDALTRAIEAAPAILESDIRELEEAFSLLCSLLALEGAVTAENVDRLMQTLTSALALLTGSQVAKEDVIIAGLAAVARLGGKGSETTIVEAVNLLVDMLELAASQPNIVAAAAHALRLLLGNDAALAAMLRLGALQMLAKHAKEGVGAAAAACKTTLKAALERLMESPDAVLGASSDPAATLLALLSVCGADVDVASLLSKVVATAVGLAAVQGALARLAADPTSDMELVAMLMQALASLNDASFLTSADGDSIGKLLLRAIDVKNSGAASAAEVAAAGVVISSALSVLSAAGLNVGTADGFADARGIDSLRRLLEANLDNPQMCAMIAAAMAALAATGSTSVLSNMALHEVISAMLSAADRLSNAARDGDEEAARALAQLLNAMRAALEMAGVSAAGLDGELMRVLFGCVDALNASGASDDDKASAEALQALVQNALGVESSDMVNVHFESAMAASLDMDCSEMLLDDGSVVYVDGNGNQCEKPAALRRLEAAMRSLGANAEGGTVKKPTQEEISRLFDILGKHIHNEAVAMGIIGALLMASGHPGVLEDMIDAAGIRALLAAARAHPHNLKLIRMLMVLLERLSRIAKHKPVLVEEGAVEVIIDIAVANHVADKDVARRSMSTLANLAYGSSDTVDRIMGARGVQATESVMATHSELPRVLESAVCLLSNLMFVRDEYKVTICELCGDDIVQVLRRFHSDVQLLRACLRALGNLSFCDENIKFLVAENDAGEALVAALNSTTDEDSVQLGIEVIGNCAVLEEPADEAEAHAIPARLHENGVVDCILAKMRGLKHNSSVLRSALSALNNMCMDGQTAEAVTQDEGITTEAVNVLRTHDFDRDVVGAAIPLLATLAYCENAGEQLAQSDAASLLLGVMDAHGADEDILVNAQQTLASLAGYPAVQESFKQDGIPTELALAVAHRTSRDFIVELLDTLGRLAADDELSEKIGEDGMHPIMQLVDEYAQQPEVLVQAFQLLTNLAFLDSNLPLIAAYEGITKITAAIAAHADHRDLVCRSIWTLDSLATASREYAMLVIDAGGRELLQEIMRSYESGDEVHQAAKSALLSLTAFENLGIEEKKKKENRGPATAVDPLAEHRNFLSAGQVLKLYTKGTPKAVHMLASADFRSVVAQDPKTRSTVAAIDLRTIQRIKAGIAEDHKKKSFGKEKVMADPEKAFSVETAGIMFAAEANVKPDATRWVEALTEWFRIFKTQPQAL